MISVYISKSDELMSFISQESHMCVKRYSKYACYLMHVIYLIK